MNAKKAVAAAPVAETEQKTTQFAPAFKYTSRQEKAAGQNFDPTWAKRDMQFTLGHAPKSPTSVMGIIYGLVSANPKIKGSELASKVRMYDFPNRKRSQYITTGIPAIGWAEDYINGAVSKGFLKIVGEAPKAEAPKAEAPKAEAKK